MDAYAGAERNYKNNVFVDYIGTKERLIEVYNAVRGTDYANDTHIEINTLKNVLYRFIQNDISFVIDGKLVVLIEHQSTINENMPIRMFEYLAKIYERMIDSDAYYRKNRIVLPRPEFIVFYNGKEEYDEKKTLKLSESYADGGGGESMELVVSVYNINRGMNKDVLDKSRALGEYVALVSKLREYEEAGYPLEKAVDDVIKYCIKNDIMVDYLKEHGSEVMSILVHEYSYEDELRVTKMEGEEKGFAAGRAEEAQKAHEATAASARRMKAKGLSTREIAEFLDIPEAEVEKL
ncbi:MAG: Rpn family recombination-promoting nuclease/putative transposase [Clostridiales Family XIII bacterium]|nr:Rpn family recombination-promoting nuclease/putative transposase [Clostridiales Family XIII bacterium]